MFTKIDLVTGAIGIRLMRNIKKIRNIPDAVFIKKNLAFGGVCFYKELAKLNIDTVIDLREEAVPEEIENGLLEYYKVGIIDGSIPTHSQMNQIHQIIKEKEIEGKTVFIHCNLGRGRATLTTMYYLLKEGLDLQTALTIVRKRKFIYLNKKQLEFLVDIEREKQA